MIVFKLLLVYILINVILLEVSHSFVIIHSKNQIKNKIKNKNCNIKICLNKTTLIMAMSSRTATSPSSLCKSIEIASTCQAGSDPDRPTKVNQDAYFVRDELLSAGQQQQRQQQQNNSLKLVGVLDGHGKKGHELNSFLSQRLPALIEEKISSLPSYEQDCRDDNYDLPAVAIEKILIEAYEEVNEEARLDPKTPAGRSGTTCVTCILDSKNGIIYTANVGDSRAILGIQNTNVGSSDSTSTSRFDTSGDDDNNNVNAKSVKDQEKWNVQALTVESTVKREEERTRIESGEGRIDSGGNVWYGPVGIAMTRCLGNVVMKRAGVIHTPDIAVIDINEVIEQFQSNSSAFSSTSCIGIIVLGTDGIFDVLTNEEVINLIDKMYSKMGNLQEVSDALAIEAKNQWLAGLPVEVKVDDTTCVLIRFEIAQ